MPNVKFDLAPLQCTTCRDRCPGAAEHNPIKTVSFALTSDDGFCRVIVTLTDFAGSTDDSAEYWSAVNLNRDSLA